MKEALYILGDVVHYLQKERGCTSIFLYSNGELFNERMVVQFSKSNDIVQSLREKLELWDATKILETELLSKLNAVLKLCLDLPNWRIQVTTKAISVSDCINHYSHQLIAPMLQLMLEIVLKIEKSNPIFVSAYNTFLHWKEWVGLERAIGAKGFGDYGTHDKNFAQHLSFLVYEQNNYQNTYFSLANEVQKTLVTDELKGDEISKINQIHMAIKESPEDETLYTMSMESWFDLLSTKIDALHRAEKRLVDTLTKEILPTKELQVDSYNGSNSVFGEYKDLILSLQLFSGIPVENLYVLLRNSQIRHFKKGKLLFLEGEQTNLFYVVLKGWVKIFKNTITGKEAILQMLGCGETILESVFFLNTSLPVSGQVVEDATLLYIPASFLREQIKTNTELTINLLSTMARNSQELLRQIENVRMKTVEERIGWFLLKLLLEQGCVSRYITLPFDKSLIASYLNMKRETFSRALKHLKKKGFKIENNTIIIPELNALCNFCDSYMNTNCAISGSQNPKNDQKNHHTTYQKNL